MSFFSVSSPRPTVGAETENRCNLLHRAPQVFDPKKRDIEKERNDTYGEIPFAYRLDENGDMVPISASADIKANITQTNITPMTPEEKLKNDLVELWGETTPTVIRERVEDCDGRMEVTVVATGVEYMGTKETETYPVLHCPKCETIVGFNETARAAGATLIPENASLKRCSDIERMEGGGYVERRPYDPDLHRALGHAKCPFCAWRAPSGCLHCDGDGWIRAPKSAP